MKFNSEVFNKEKSFTILLYGLLLILCIAPFLMATSFHDSQRLITTLAITSILSIRLFTSSSFSKESLLFIFILMAWGGYSSSQSAIPKWSLIEVSLFISIALTSLFIFERPSIWLLTKLTLIFAVIQSFYILVDYFNYILTFIVNDKLNVWEIIDGFSNIRFYAQFLSWTIPFLIGYLAIQKNDQYRSFITTIVILSWTLVLISGTRAFILGMIFSLLSVFLVIPNTWKHYTIWTLMTGLAGVIGYIIFVFILPSIFGLNNSDALNSTIDRDFSNSSGRIQIWIDTLQIAMSHPYTGIGPMMTAMDGVLDHVSHPHNFLLQLMAEWGIPFAFLFTGLAVYLSYKWQKLVSKNPTEREPLALPITAAASSAFAAGLVDGLMVMPVSLFYMSIIIGFGTALWREWTPHEKRFESPVWLTTLLLVPVLFLASITTYQWFEKTNNSIYSSAFAPRFWLNGKISQNSTLFHPTQTERHNVVFK